MEFHDPFDQCETKADPFEVRIEVVEEPKVPIMMLWRDIKPSDNANFIEVVIQ